MTQQAVNQKMQKRHFPATDNALKLKYSNIVIQHFPGWTSGSQHNGERDHARHVFVGQSSYGHSASRKKSMQAICRDESPQLETTSCQGNTPKLTYSNGDLQQIKRPRTSCIKVRRWEGRRSFRG